MLEQVVEKQGVSTEQLLEKLPAFLSLAAEVARAQRGEGKMDKSAFLELTAYQYEIMDFVAHEQNREVLKDFWRKCEALASQNGAGSEWRERHKGLISQVAVYKILAELGAGPELAPPEEDAFDAVDLKAQGRAIQIKGVDEGEPQMIATDDIALPWVDVKKWNEQRLVFGGYLQTKLEDFKLNIPKYNKRHQTNPISQGYVTVIPQTVIDSVTGEVLPQARESVLQLFTRKLRKEA